MRWILGCVIVAAACGGERDYGPERATAKQAAGRLVKELMPKLVKALGDGPPEHALDVCSKVAQSITADIRESEGVSVRRTSLRCRNPANKPDAEEEKWLQEAMARDTVPTKAESWVSGDELRYVQPIVIKKVCLQCHGTELSPAVRELLGKLYPGDTATGYAEGDLRGIVSVRVPIR